MCWLGVFPQVAYYRLSPAWKNQLKETQRLYNSSGQGTRAGPGCCSAKTMCLILAKALPTMVGCPLRWPAAGQEHAWDLPAFILELFPRFLLINSTCFNWDGHMDLAHMLVTLLNLSSELMKPLRVKSPMKQPQTGPKIQCQYWSVYSLRHTRKKSGCFLGRKMAFWIFLYLPCPI